MEGLGLLPWHLDGSRHVVLGFHEYIVGTLAASESFVGRFWVALTSAAENGHGNITVLITEFGFDPAGYRTTGNWGERPFTKDTVNRLLRNVFYLGFVKYKGELYPGKHPALISQELFDRAQEARASLRPKRKSFGKRKHVYVLAGLVRCDSCGLTLRCGASATTRYYRHLAKTRGVECALRDQGINADELEDDWADIMAAIQLPEDWRKRAQVQEKLKRLKQVFRDLLIDDIEYHSSLESLQGRLASPVPPSAPQLVEAGEYLENLGQLWREATLAEQTEITRLLVNAVYIDVGIHKIEAIEPKPIFRLLFEEVCEGIKVKLL